MKRVCLHPDMRWLAVLIVAFAFQPLVRAVAILPTVPPIVIFEKGSLVIIDGDRDRDGKIEQNQNATFQIPLTNSRYSQRDALNVTAELTSSNSVVQIVDASSAYGTIPVGAKRDPQDGGFIVRVPSVVTGSVEFSLKVSYQDGQGGKYTLGEPFAVSVPVESQIISDNRAPVINPTIPNPSPVNEDESITMALSAYETDDRDRGSDLNWSVARYDSNMISSVSGANSSSDRLTILPKPNVFGSTTVTLRLTDSGGLYDEQDVTLTWRAVNDPPVIQPISDMVVTVGALVQVQPVVSDPDNDPLVTTYSPPLNQSGRWQTGSRDAGEYNLEVRVTDGSLTASAPLKLTVLNGRTNSPPVVETIDDITVQEGELVIVNVTASDPDGDNLVITYGSPLDSEGRWQTTYNDAGVYNCLITVSDGVNSVDRRFAITVRDATPPSENINLIAYYPFEQNSGDQSGNANGGVIFGADFVEGVRGQGIHFNGASDYIQIPDSASLNSPTGTKELSIAFWVKLDDTDSRGPFGVLAKEEDGGGNRDYGVYFYPAEGKFKLFIGSGGESREDIETSRMSWLPNRWYHIVFTYDVVAKSAVVYVDGVSKRSRGSSRMDPLIDTQGSLTIGLSKQNYFQGTLDEVRLYNKVLSRSEVKKLYEEYEF